MKIKQVILIESVILLVSCASIVFAGTDSTKVALPAGTCLPMNYTGVITGVQGCSAGGLPASLKNCSGSNAAQAILSPAMPAAAQFCAGRKYIITGTYLFNVVHDDSALHVSFLKQSPPYPAVCHAYATMRASVAGQPQQTVSTSCIFDTSTWGAITITPPRFNNYDNSQDFSLVSGYVSIVSIP